MKALTRWPELSWSVLLVLLAGCGGGAGSSPDEQSATPEPAAANGEAARDVRSGVFVDSAVEGLDWATETRSGVTDGDGRFTYLPGERVTFSIGAAVLPAVPAAPRLTPIDLGRDARDVEQFATNVARLLQSLDTDDDPGNGIEIPADAAGAASAVNFDVALDVFERDTAVVNLVAGAGGKRTELVSVDSAREHFARTLGAIGGEAGATATIAGFWEVVRSVDEFGQAILPVNVGDSVDLFDISDLAEVDDPFSAQGQGVSGGADAGQFLAISADGELRTLSAGFDDSGLCHYVDHETLTPLGSRSYLLASPEHGGLSRADIALAGNRLVFTAADPYSPLTVTRTASPVSGMTPESLTLCAGESLQRQPPVSDRLADMAGHWVAQGEEEPAHYIFSASGAVERLVVSEGFGPAPDYRPSLCHAVTGFKLKVYRNDNFELQSIDEEYRFITGRRDGDALVLGVYDATLALGQTRLTRSAADIATLERCDPGVENDPFDSIEGLWRNADDGVFGHYVEINEYGVLNTWVPDIGGDACYVNDASTLSALGGLDFESQRADGQRRTLRMQPMGDTLVIADVASDGSASPVRWLESVRGIDPATFSVCQQVTTAADLQAVKPLVGTWSRITREYTGPYGENGEDIPEETQTEYWMIAANGDLSVVETITSLQDRFALADGGTPVYDSCRTDRSSPQAHRMEAVGSDVFRFNGSAWTLSQEGGSLRAQTAHDDIEFTSTAIDPLALEPCFPDQFGSETTIFDDSPKLWVLDSSRKQGAQLLMLSEYDSFTYRFDPVRQCSVVQPVRVEALADDRLLVEWSATGNRESHAVAGSGVGRFSIANDELHIAFESIDEKAPLASGRYPVARGFDRDRLYFESNCY